MVSPVMVDVAASTLALGLILVAFVQLVTGRSLGLGHAFRSVVEPALSSFRASSPLTRSELADRTMVVAVALATAGAVVQRSISGVILVAMLLRARPMVRKATQQDHKLLAVAGTYSTDLLIGFYLPMTLAQILLANYLFAASMAAVMVALCWPAGGGHTIPGRRWQLAPVVR